MRPSRRADARRPGRRPPTTGSVGKAGEMPKPGTDTAAPNTSGTGFSQEVQRQVLLNHQREWRTLDELMNMIEKGAKSDKEGDIAKADALSKILGRVGTYLAAKQVREREAYRIDLTKFDPADPAAEDKRAEGLAFVRRVLAHAEAMKRSMACPAVEHEAEAVAEAQ